MNVKHNRLCPAVERSEAIAPDMFMLYVIVITTTENEKRNKSLLILLFCAFALGNPHGNNSIKI